MIQKTGFRVKLSETGQSQIGFRTEEKQDGLKLIGGNLLTLRPLERIKSTRTICVNLPEPFCKLKIKIQQN